MDNDPLPLAAPVEFFYDIGHTDEEIYGKDYVRRHRLELIDQRRKMGYFIENEENDPQEYDTIIQDCFRAFDGGLDVKLINSIYEGTFKANDLINFRHGEEEVHKFHPAVHHDDGTWSRTYRDITADDFKSLAEFIGAVSNYIAVWARFFCDEHPKVTAAMTQCLSWLCTWELRGCTSGAIIEYSLKHLGRAMENPLDAESWTNFQGTPEDVEPTSQPGNSRTTSSPGNFRKRRMTSVDSDDS